MKLSAAEYNRLRESILDKTYGSLSPALRKRLAGLVSAHENPAEDPQRKPKTAALWDAGKVTVRTEMANLRKAIRSAVWPLSTLKDCVLNIPDRDRDEEVYRLEVHPPSAHERFWLAHLQNSKPLDAIVFERLFFKYGPDTYIRNIRANEDDEKEKLLEVLECFPTKRSQKEWEAFVKGLRASRHYLSSGEMAAAIELQNFLSEEFAAFLRSRHVKINFRKEDAAPSGNDIVIAASLVGDAETQKNNDEYFESGEDGILPGCKDQPGNGDSRIVHVLLDRKCHDGSVRTILQGSHGRAIEGVCRMQLTSPEAIASLLSLVDLGEEKFPKQFQIVFQVSLVYDKREKRSKAVRVIPIKWAVGHKVKELRQPEKLIL